MVTFIPGGHTYQIDAILSNYVGINFPKRLHIVALCALVYETARKTQERSPERVRA